ncbi:MAG: hypothetical protein RR632_07705, partial [Christensenella sp.]
KSYNVQNKRMVYFMQKSKLRFLCFIIILVLFSAAIFSSCAVSPYLTIWEENPFGDALPAAEDVEIIARHEYSGKDFAQILWLQFTDEQAAVFEQNITATGSWRPLPIPPDVEKFSFAAYLTSEDEQASAYFRSCTNGYWMLYNCTDTKHVFDADSLSNTRRFTFSVYAADSKQLLIYEDSLY